MIKLVNSNCWPALRSMANASVDAVVTDPPYGLSFMNKKWDYDVPHKAIWQEVFRVLKPGGHLLSFGGTRTYHRMVVAIEDAGFEIRDQVQWLYGSGFPKSHDVSKGMDKQAGAEREVIGKIVHHDIRNNSLVGKVGLVEVNITTPATDLAKKWQGWGTALKPANEPICLARKPLEKGLTVAENVAKWGTGAINIDASRIGYANKADLEYLTSHNQNSRRDGNAFTSAGSGTDQENPKWEVNQQGRWPANIILDEDAAKALDEQSGISKSGKAGVITADGFNANTYGKGMGIKAGQANGEFGDSGGASRFFYVAKASKRERNAGLEGMPDVRSGTERMNNSDGRKAELGESDRLTLTKNHHPTVKPIKLMEYLIRMITPPNGVVLDPFMGSGTTGIAAKNLDFGFIGIELSEEYFNIAEKRMGES